MRKLFEEALQLQITQPWYVSGVALNAATQVLTIWIDFTPVCFEVSDGEPARPPYDVVVQRYQYLDFFQYQCCLEVRVPRVKLPDGALREVTPGWAENLVHWRLE